MNYTRLKTLVDGCLSTREIAKELDISQTSVRYWLNKYELSTSPSKKYECSFCGETDKTKFYGHKHTRCGNCHNKDTIKRGTENKDWAIAFMGGECQSCGYSKSSWALQFHHVNPDIKDKNFNSMRGWSRKRIQKELSSCVLLCANCHYEEHEKLHRA